MEPIFLAYVGVAVAVALSGIASIYGTIIPGSATVGAIKKDSSVFGSCMLLTVIPSTQGLYGFAGYFMIKGFLVAEITLLQGVAILWSCVALGVICIFSAVQQGKLCANGITAIGNGHKVFGNTLILAVIPELYPILGLALVFLVSTSIQA